MAIALLFGYKCLIFITFQCAIKINQFQVWSFFTKIPRLQPYLSPLMPHFHHLSICNQYQSLSILVICHQTTNTIALLLARHASLSSFVNLQSKSIKFKFGHFSPTYQAYSLTFWQQMPHFHHLSICKHNQSISNLVICHQNTKAIALLFGQTCLIFITYQSVIKINQFQFWSFLPQYQGYSLTFCPKMPHCHHFSICNQNQSISSLVMFHQNTKAIALLFGQKCLIFITFQSAIKINQFQFWSFFTKIPRLQPYCLATNASFSSLVNLQAQSINFKFGHLSPKYQGYSLTVWPNLPHFHHLSICNQNQSISILVLFTTIPKLQPYFLATNASLSSLFNLQSKSVNFKFGHVSPKYQGYIALRFGQKCLIFITFQSAIKINQFQVWSCFTKVPRLQPYFLARNASFSSLFNLQSISINFNFGHFSPKYQGYSLTVWPQMPHFHHFSICNQNHSISNLIMFHQDTKAIALLFGETCHIFITYQSAIKINQFQIWSFFNKMPRLQPQFLAKHASFRVQKKSRLHGSEPEENFTLYVVFEEGFEICIDNPVSANFSYYAKSTVKGIAHLQLKLPRHTQCRVQTL